MKIQQSYTSSVWMFTVILLIVNSSLNYSQWEQNTGITGGDVRAIVSDGSTLVAGIDGGGIFISEDNGLNWTRNNEGLTNLYVRSLIQTGRYFFAGLFSTGICASTNQGLSWYSVNSGLPNSTVTAMEQIDSLVFAAMVNKIYFSSNSGNSWIFRSAGLPINQINTLTKKDTSIFVGTTDGLYFSSDYGETWINRSNGLTNRNINDLTVFNDYIFASSFGGHVYKSSDDGQNWLLTGNGLPQTQILSLTKTDSSLFAGTFGSGIFISSDFGANWTPYNEGYPTGSLTQFLEAFGNSIFACSESGIYELKLNETEWHERTNGLYAHNVNFIVNKNEEIYVGTSGSQIFISTNGGLVWRISKVANSFSSILQIAFKGDTLYCVNNGYAYFSNDLGYNWQLLNLSSFQLSSVAVKDNKIFVGTLGTDGLWMSTNGGLNWSQKNNGLTTVFVTCINSDDENIYVGTTNGLFISSDGGENWHKAQTGISPSLSVSMIKVIENRVYAGGAVGLYVSENNGATWVMKGFQNQLVDCLTGNSNILFAGSWPNGVFKSTNFGMSWQLYNEGLPNHNIYSVELYDTTLFAGVYGHGLWNKSVSTLTDYSDKENLVYGYELEQNYPNPFNPTTKIKFSIPQTTSPLQGGERGGLVTLKVYDILGNEITTLVNENKPAGTYEVEFQSTVGSSQLASGVYYYQLVVGNFIETKKMILLK